MSKKRNVAYVKPQEPSFLTKLKKDAGYVEGPTVDTKREQLPYDSHSDEDSNDEQPTVVVLKPGDLTAEEAAQEAEKKAIEKESAPADLSERIVFQKPVGTKRNSVECDSTKPSKKSKKNTNKKLLSFDEEEEEEY